MSSSASKSLESEARAIRTRAMIAALEAQTAQERKRCDDIVCEEWQRIVKEFDLRPGSVTETCSGRVINRIRGIE